MSASAPYAAPAECREPGCPRPATARGLCNAHYKAHRRACTLPPRASLTDRLWSRVVRTDGCWEWTGPVADGRWGYISDYDETRLVHRVAYELQFGPIDDGLVIRQQCGNRRCVRPDHLRAEIR